MCLLPPESHYVDATLIILATIALTALSESLQIKEPSTCSSYRQDQKPLNGYQLQMGGGGRRSMEPQELLYVKEQEQTNLFKMLIFPSHCLMDRLLRNKETDIM